MNYNLLPCSAKIPSTFPTLTFPVLSFPTQEESPATLTCPSFNNQTFSSAESRSNLPLLSTRLYCPLTRSCASEAGICLPSTAHALKGISFFVLVETHVPSIQSLETNFPSNFPVC